jgi:hypothetical protein
METELKAQYDEISPITGKLTVLAEIDPNTGLQSKLCMESGFTTNELMTNNTQTAKDFISRSPKLIQDLALVDENDLIWFPLTMQTEHAIFYPDGTSESDWVWKIAEVVDIPESEREKYPVIGKENEYYDKRLAIEEASWFQNDQFDLAFTKFYDILKAKYNTNE